MRGGRAVRASATPHLTTRVSRAGEGRASSRPLSDGRISGCPVNPMVDDPMKAPDLVHAVGNADVDWLLIETIRKTGPLLLACLFHFNCHLKKVEFRSIAIDESPVIIGKMDFPIDLIGTFRRFLF